MHPSIEKKIAEKFYPKYDELSKMKKVEIYKYVIEHTEADDLRK